MTGVLLLLLIVFATGGLALSFIVHVVSFTSVQLGDDLPFPALLWGMFPAFVSVILIGRSERQRKMPQAADKDVDYWGLVLEGCPALIKYAFWGCFFYAWATGMVGVLSSPRKPNEAWRLLSAFEMTFYSMSLAVALAAFLRRRALN